MVGDPKRTELTEDQDEEKKPDTKDSEKEQGDNASRGLSKLIDAVHKLAEEGQKAGENRDKPDAFVGPRPELGDKKGLLAKVADNVPAKVDDRAAPKAEAKPDEKKEIIELSKLAPEKQTEVERTRELQGFILRFADKLKFGSDDERKAFLEKLQKELGEPVEGGEGKKFNKLPECGEASKEGFKKLIDFLQKGAVPDYVSALDKQLLGFPPGFPLKIAGKQEEILKSSEQLKQELAQGKGYLDIDPNKLEDVRKLGRVTDWMNAADKSLHDEHIRRLETYLSKKVEDGIKKGIYPEAWRRPEGMDKETWCSALEQTMNAYTRATRVIEAINYLNNSGTKFKSDALDKGNLPPEVNITRDSQGKITNVDFGKLMVPDLALSSDANRQKLDPLTAWCDKYEADSQKALREAFKDRTQVAGFGEAEVSGGWVNPTTKEFVMGRKDCPGSDWKPFNLLTYDMDIKEQRDAFGRVSKVTVGSDVGFQEVPWFGYLNTCGTDKFREKSQKPTEYAPDDYVAVQTGPGQIQMIQAKELSDWKALEQLKYYGEKAVIATMDAAMVVSGVGEIRAGLKVAEIGVKEAVKVGGQVLKTEVVGELPKNLAARMYARGAFDIGMGLTGVFHNAGAKEIPWMKTVSDLRTAYFLGHAGYSVASLARLPQGARALGEAVSPSALARVDGAITSIKGTEAAIRNGELAKAGALESMPFWKGLDKATHRAFWGSEKLFVGMFLWDVAGMTQRFADPYRPGALDNARQALNSASMADRSALEKIIAAGNQPSERAENYFRRYADTLAGMDDKSKKECADIIAKVKELSKPGSKEEDKQKFIQDLMKYMRYDGGKISAMQNNRFSDNLLSEAKLTKDAQNDQKNFDPNLRRVAAMAMLALSRKPDGSWPETIATRDEPVPVFKEQIQSGDTIITRDVGPTKITQNVSSAELVALLQSDMRATNDAKIRTEKAAALHENGLVSSEQMADLLLARVEGSQGESKETRIRALTDLAGLVSRLKVEEHLRGGIFNKNEQYAVKGLTAGLSSAELMQKLEKIALDSNDKDVKATALLSLSMLKKENLDDTDKQRIRDFFLKEPPGISEADYKALMEADAASKPSDKAGWERKLIAAETLLRHSMVSSIGDNYANLDMKAVGYLHECLKAPNQPEIAVKALEALTKEERLGGSPLSALVEKEPEQRWKNKIVADALNLFNQTSTGLNINQQIEAAKARVKLIDLVTPLVKDTEGSVYKRQLLAHLAERAATGSEPVEEVRAAAVKAIGELGIREKEQVDLLRKAVDLKTEASPSVRLAALDAIERLVPRSRERKEILAPLAVAETDPAVKERLARYYEATGSIKDRNSQAARQDVADARREQNREAIPPADVEKMVEARFPKLFGSGNIFDYISASREPYRNLNGTTNLASIWQSELETINSWWSQDHIKEWARDHLTNLELVAQNRAVKAYNKGVDDLAEKAMGGSGEKTVQVGDKRFSEADAAVLSLGLLVRGGSRMGKPFTEHRLNDNIEDHKPGTRPFSAREQRVRSEYANGKDWWGKPINQTIYRTDPWNQTEQKIAEKMRDLCSESSGKVNLSLLKDQIFLALDASPLNAAKTSDPSRKILVDGLDRLLSNPKTSPEAKQDIIKRVAQLVRESTEVAQGKTESMVALIGLLDKHGKAAYEKDSLAYSVIRNNLEARTQMESVNSPPQVRLRAQEMFDREWQSVLSEYDKIPAGQVSARARMDLLPKNFEAFEKAAGKKPEGYDEEVQDAVQRIIMATKGLPLGADDPRTKTLIDLTDQKYDDRVRMAALQALAESKDDRSFARGALLDLAMQSPDRAIRNDAAKLLLRSSGGMVSEGSVEGLRSELAEKLALAQGKKPEDIAGKSPDDLLKEANDYISKNLKDGEPREKEKARELLQAMHRYGEGLALIANLKASDKYGRTEAERIFKLSMSAFGVSEADIASLKDATKRNSHWHSSEEPGVKDLANRLIERLQQTGSVPGLVSALTGYGKFTSAKLEDKGQIADNLAQGIGLVSLGEAIAKVYYPSGSQGLADEYRSLSNFYQGIGQRMALKERWYGNAVQFMDKAKAELESYRKTAELQPKSSRDGLNQSIDKQVAGIQSERLQARFELYSAMTSRIDAKTSTYQRARIKEYSDELENELQAASDKNAAAFKAQRFIKDWLDTRLVADDKKPEAKAKAEASLDAALKQSAAEFGANSPHYEMMLKKMWSYHAAQGQPDKAEAFFKDGLAKMTDSTQTANRIVLLRQYYQMLKAQKRENDANEIASEYKRIGGP